eukprot:3943871-Amphidinium_carterae.1
MKFRTELFIYTPVQTVLATEPDIRNTKSTKHADKYNQTRLSKTFKQIHYNSLKHVKAGFWGTDITVLLLELLKQNQIEKQVKMEPRSAHMCKRQH